MREAKFLLASGMAFVEYQVIVMNQEDELLKKRFAELAKRSYQNNMYTFTGFLNVNEQALFYEMERELCYASPCLFGGTENSERKMLRFGSEAAFGYEEAFPICCVIVKPLMKKFADDLTHRDFLGSLMNLGIERSVLGDIFIKDKEAYILCDAAMASYIAENLSRVKHTSMLCAVSETMPEAIQPSLEAMELIVSSDRVDAVIAKAYSLSRSQSVELFRAKRIFVNGRQYENNSGILKTEDVVSVRGFGKFVFEGILQETKKGRFKVRIQKYI